MTNKEREKPAAKEKAPVFEFGGKLRKEETYDLKYGDCIFTVRFLTTADLRAAERAALIDNSNPKKPEYDREKQGEEMVIAALKGWRHVSGASLVEDGQPIEVNRTNILRMLEALPGLGSYIINCVSSADKMYRTLRGEDIKN